MSSTYDSTYRYARKEMLHKKRKARRQPTNRRVDPQKHEAPALDTFLPEPKELHCGDCGEVLESGTVRRIGQAPYCRGCFLTRVGKNVHTRD